MIKRSALSIFFIFIALFTARAQTVSAVVTGVSENAAEIRLRTFDHVWTTVNDRHFDPTFGGVDWNRVRRIYEPKVKAAKTDAELHTLLQKMLGELKQSHFNVFPPDAEISATSFGEGEIGIDVRLIGNDVVITRVDPNSIAEIAGLKTGYILQSVDGKPVSAILAPVEQRLKLRNETGPKRLLYLSRAILYAVGGKAGSFVKLQVLDEYNRVRLFQLERTAFAGEMSPPLGHFQAQRMVFESRRIEGNIGYIRFNVWVVPQMAKIREAIRSLRDTRGIIFDLRGNPGGIGMMAAGVAGFLVKEESSLGTMTSRSGEIKFLAYPQTNPFPGGIVILTDALTASTSEVFAAGMQEIGRAKVIGEVTAGAVLPSVFEKLPTNAIFQYAVSDYRSPKKVLLEGRGVIPDIEIKPDRKSLLEGRDSQLEAAIKELSPTK